MQRAHQLLAGERDVTSAVFLEISLSIIPALHIYLMAHPALDVGRFPAGPRYHAPPNTKKGVFPQKRETKSSSEERSM